MGCVGLLGMVVGVVRSDDPAPMPTGQAAKPIPLRADIGKTVHIEPPTKKLVANNSAIVVATDNPKVKPGLVKWHATFAEASEASKKSGKPVLLFQMMGKLDDQFC
jgi:hypothetical protein